MHPVLKQYQGFATTLAELLRDSTAVQIRVKGYMPLSIEHIGPSPDGLPMIAISHTGEQNGDLMRDPEIVFALHQGPDDVGPLADPIEFRNDYLGIHHEVYVYDDAGRRVGLRQRLKLDLVGFASTWFRNLKEQGFLDAAATREELGSGARD